MATTAERARRIPLLVWSWKKARSGAIAARKSAGTGVGLRVLGAVEGGGDSMAARKMHSPLEGRIRFRDGASGNVGGG
ncbi:hypothetical protein MFU01_73520 [Myxococcus fulvus]|uniref:Uncharacterized protein n=1 Tax=Myxococcus fulvus TaxID=33 RepID=A0A511TDT0_MYXFU|nr:hypothetical protein MFU01_73520 [Myxococcus fulvus]